MGGFYQFFKLIQRVWDCFPVNWETLGNELKNRIEDLFLTNSNSANDIEAADEKPSAIITRAMNKRVPWKGSVATRGSGRP